MITRLRLENFKSFEDATLELGAVTVLIGTNASGKSNIGDAFKVLQGVTKGYPIEEIFEKNMDTATEQWSGIRGGSNFSKFDTSKNLNISIDCIQPAKLKIHRDSHYNISINPSESVWLDRLAFGSHLIDGPMKKNDRYLISSAFLDSWYRLEDYELRSNQIGYNRMDDVLLSLSDMNSTLSEFMLLEFDGAILSEPYQEKRKSVGRRGEYLSSTLKHICTDKLQKKTLEQWLQRLTPMDAVSLLFDTDISGYVTLILKEKNGRKITARSASDGTLRFLGYLALLFHPKPPKLIFIEEIETGIHPTRLKLLIQLIEERTKAMGFQVILTTHAPQVLNLVSDETLESCSVIYRLPGQGSSKIRRLMDVPEIKEELSDSGPAFLHQIGWLESMLEHEHDVEEEDEIITDPALLPRPLGVTK
jgi:AAA15 family ATPase/GTPase